MYRRLEDVHAPLRDMQAPRLVGASERDIGACVVKPRVVREHREFIWKVHACFMFIK